MNEAIELHDSVLDSVAMRDGIVVVALRPAYIHRSLGEPGVDDGSGFIQDVNIEFGMAQVEGTLGPLPSDIYEGDLEFAGVLYPYMIRLPSGSAKEARLTLHLSPDYRMISISGELLKVELVSAAEYVEEFRRRLPPCGTV